MFNSNTFLFSLAPTPVCLSVNCKSYIWISILSPYKASRRHCGGRHGGGQGGQQMAYMVADKKIIGRHFVGHGGRHVKKQVFKF